MKDVPLNVIFGQNLRTKREALGYTQADLAARLKLARATISAIEHGRQNLTLSTMKRFADAVDDDVRSLLTPVK